LLHRADPHCRIRLQPEGAAELLVAPPREVLVATAAAVAAAAALPGGCGVFRFNAAFEDEEANADSGFAERVTCAMARGEAAARKAHAPPAECC
jgi:hypothetical protein